MQFPAIHLLLYRLKLSVLGFTFPDAYVKVILKRETSEEIK